MNAEKIAQIASITEASPSSHETLLREFSLENDKCICVDDATETCMHCAVKEYQEALQKVKDYSVKCGMPKTKKSRRDRKRLHQTCVQGSEENGISDENVQRPKNGKVELHRDQSCDTESSRFNIDANSILELTQNNYTSLQPRLNIQTDHYLTNTNFQNTEISTTDVSLAQSLQIQSNRSSKTECRHEHSQLETEFLNKNESCDVNSGSDHLMSESNHEIGSRSDSSELSDEDRDDDIDHSNSSENLTEFKPKISPDIKVEPYIEDFYSNETVTDCQRDQNHPPDSSTVKCLNIKTVPCDMDSNSNEAEACHNFSNLANELHIKSEPCDIYSKEGQDDREHSKLKNELHVKREPCDTNSDSEAQTSENSQEIKSHSESFEHSDEASDRYNTLSTMEGKIENSDVVHHDDLPPNQDLKRSRRNSKRKREMEDRCPVCGLTVRFSDLESHFAKEVENLSNIAKNVRKNRTSHKDQEDLKGGVNLAYVQAKCNRENRLAAKRAKYVRKHEVFCPVCKIKLSGTDEEINGHVLECFGEDEDSDINVTDFDENFEEYEIGDQTRIRAISLVPGGHSALHGYSSKSKSTNDEDEGVDVNVDVDDTLAFGKPQYTELDVIHNTSEGSDEKEEQLRRAVVTDPSAEPHVIEGRKWSQDIDIQNDIDEIIGSCKGNKPEEVKSKENDEDDIKGKDDFKEADNSQNTDSEIISSLKEKIKDLEQQKSVKCLICLEPYTRPVVSTTCWHVHCEECWLMSMGVKKLCPQCNMIVFPTDLRRIYL